MSLERDGAIMSDVILGTLEAYDLKLTATLVKDEFNGREGMAKWAITIHTDGQCLQTEYSMGCAHRHHPRNPNRPIKLPSPYKRLTVDELERLKRTVPNKPELTDVMYSLVLDAQCVAFGQTFEDFAAELGYDEDSRTAERAFNACRDTYFGLIRMVGQKGFEELCELYQDY